jgi:hypothetical protein
MNVQNFIKQLYIKEVSEIKDVHPYIAYMVIGAGIEFLGKVLEQPSRNDWFEEGHSKSDFENAVLTLPGLNNYSAIKEPLYRQLRCGLIHSSLPKRDLKLGDKNTVENIAATPYELNIDNFYNAFKTVCEDVIKQVDEGAISITGDFLEVEEVIVQNQQPQPNVTGEKEPTASQTASPTVTSVSGCYIPQQTLP